MNRRDIGRVHRLLRQRARLTQAEVTSRSGVGRWKIVDLEANRLDRLTVGDIDRCFASLDASLILTVAHRGAEIDRLLDQGHATLLNAVVRLLKAAGWEVRVEVTFNEFGDRGSIDVLAWHAMRRALLVIEVKSELASVEGTLRPFAVKCRLAPRIAVAQFGWQPLVVGRVLVLPEERSARRAVERHAAAFDAGLPARSREVRAWLRDPARAIGGIWFLSDVGRSGFTRNPSAVRRVRHSRSRSVESR